VVTPNRGTRGIAGRQDGRGVPAARARTWRCPADSLAIIRSGLYGVVADPKEPRSKARSHRTRWPARPGPHRSTRGGRIGKDDPPLPTSVSTSAWSWATPRPPSPRIAFRPSSSNTAARRLGAAPVAWRVIDNYFDSVVPPRIGPRRGLARHGGGGPVQDDFRLAIHHRRVGIPMPRPIHFAHLPASTSLFCRPRRDASGKGSLLGKLRFRFSTGG